jgi:hypothetical protein
LWRSGWWQQDTETCYGEPEQNLTRSEQVSNARRAQDFQLRQPPGIRVATVQPSLVQLPGVPPHLLPRLSEKALGAQPIQRGKHTVYE